MCRVEIISEIRQGVQEVLDENVGGNVVKQLKENTLKSRMTTLKACAGLW